MNPGEGSHAVKGREAAVSHIAGRCHPLGNFNYFLHRAKAHVTLTNFFFVVSDKVVQIDWLITILYHVSC